MPPASKYYRPDLTLPDVLKRASQHIPELFIGYYDKNNNLTVQTYKELHSEARIIAAGFQNLGLKSGDKIIIATRKNTETIEMLWGAFLAGIVPTVLQAPANFSEDNPSAVKIFKVFELLDHPYVLLSPDMKEDSPRLKGKIRHKEDLDFSGTLAEPHLSPDDLAFIQFSSGSTGEPKGVMLTHQNLVINMDAIRCGMEANDQEKFGNWMPLFHDMGLIGYHITPMYSILTQYQVETMDFIMNPGLWLNMMSREHVTITGTTNFGLALVLKHLTRGKQVYDWDFSVLKDLLNGAEPISVKTMNDFIEALAPYSLKPEALMPVYGMAESTLAISFATVSDPPVTTAFDALLLDREHIARCVDPSDPSARMLSAVGFALNDMEIRITDGKDRVVKEGIAGHIQIKGPTVTRGYYKNPAATTAAFCGEWLRTGDIGFFFEGHLYISGRFKDIIFKNGIHYFANDLEELACILEEIKVGKVCMGGFTDNSTGDEKIIAFLAGVAEEKSKETFRKLRTVLRSHLGIDVDLLVLLRSNEIPKTSSGKLQRYKLMQRFLNGDFSDRIIYREKQTFL